jgi:hypothetical protein
MHNLPGLPQNHPQSEELLRWIACPAAGDTVIREPTRPEAR